MNYFPLFSFLKYLQPTHYFHLKPGKNHGIFPTREQIQRAGWDLKVDSNYTTNIAQERDLAYRAFQLGLVNEDSTEGLDVWKKVEIPVMDEYQFIRKNFHPVWSLYVLFIRLVTFHNPLKELTGFLKTQKVRRVLYHESPQQFPELKEIETKVITNNSKVSIIIPTLNRYQYLKDALTDLENQTYKNFEVIVVDQSEPFNKEFYDAFDLEINVIHQAEKALWLARNNGIKAAQHEIVAFTEDDVRLPNVWLMEHLKCLFYFNADISSGVFYPTGETVPKERNFYKFSEQFATGNVLLYKKVFEENGYYDRTFERQRMGDGEYGLRCFVSGYRSISNPKACCEDVKAPVGGLRQMGSWDAFRPKKFFGPRPIPSVLYFFRKYYGVSITLWSLLKNVPPSIMPYQFKRNRPLMLIGSMLSVLLMPIIFFQVALSWRRSSMMLQSQNS